MEAKEYIREKTRMFDSLRDAERKGSAECEWVSCDECPLCTESKDCLEHTEESVDIVEKWSKEHPIKTIMDDLLEKYPNARMIASGRPSFCARGLGHKVECKAGGCIDCWNTPMEAK